MQSKQERWGTEQEAIVIQDPPAKRTPKRNQGEMKAGSKSKQSLLQKRMNPEGQELDFEPFADNIKKGDGTAMAGKEMNPINLDKGTNEDGTDEGKK